MAEILTCSECGHSRRITADILARWGIRVTSMTTVDIRAALSEKSEKLVCRACGARHPRIATESEKKQQRQRADRRSMGHVEKVLKLCGNWLYSREFELLQSFLSQVQSGHSLNSRQLEVLDRIEKRALMRQGPKFVGGGGPGTGRRR